jgi:hypothetical protein
MEVKPIGNNAGPKPLFAVTSCEYNSALPQSRHALSFDFMVMWNAA